MSSIYPRESAESITAAVHTDVCVVDDEPVIAEVVCELLEDAEIHATACPIGWHAHRCIRNKRPKVVILDVQMPEIDGIRLFYLLRADPVTHDIPVIFLTANAFRVLDEVPNFQELGADLVPKPFDASQLLARVEQALES
jgi:DNA-binding response OmpR family regulator